LTVFRSPTLIVLAAALLLAAGSAAGQGAPGAPSQNRGNKGGLDTSHVPASKSLDQGEVPATLVSAVQYRLELLEDDLRLRPDQNAAWLAFRKRVLSLAEDTQRNARVTLGADMNGPKRLDRLADLARDRLTAVEDIADAGKALYATLSPTQQGVADRLMAVPVMALVGFETATGASRPAAPAAKP
jgi:LTXXQ motif family protein